MAALQRVRQIEETLRQAQCDPRLIKIICEIAERQRVQHQQIYEVAKLIVAFQDHMSQIHKQLAIRDGNLEKLGVQEMMTNMQSKSAGLISSVEEFDEEGSAHNDSREKN